jgi:hypothetical protein
VSAPPILVFTYYRVAPVGQLGVFKRCTRMIEGLVDDFDVHLVHFGSLPAESQYEAIRDRLVTHEVPGDAVAATLERIFDEVRPEAIVLGEAPLRGSLRLAHRMATRRGIWQVGVENIFYREFAVHATSEWPAVDRWLLLGLLESGGAERLSRQCAAVPPLLRFPAGFGSFVRDRISIIAYDRLTLLTALRVLELLPRSLRADVFVSPETQALLQENGTLEGRPGVRVLMFPDDATIYDSLARARVVFGKAGYGQIVESLQLGARILCRACPGGINDELVSLAIRPYVHILPSDLEFPALTPMLDRWLAAPPVNDWAEVAVQHPDTIAVAASTLRELLDERKTAPEPRRSSTGPDRVVRSPDVPAALSIFRYLVENLRWAELREQLGDATIWVYDHPLGAAELVEMLEGIFANAEDLRLQAIGPTTKKSYGPIFHVSQPSCAMWGTTTSWDEHEMKFDLHVGCLADGSDDHLTYVGITQATPEGDPFLLSS